MLFYPYLVNIYHVKLILFCDIIYLKENKLYSDLSFDSLSCNYITI